MTSNMKKVRLGCDIDGVIYRFQDTANYLFKTHWGYDIGEWKSWDYAQEFVSDKAWKWLWDEGIRKYGLFRYGSIYKGSREFLARASDKCDIVVLTSRPPLATLDTMEWLGYQRFPTSEVHIIRDRNGQKKSDVLPHCDVYLDDGAHNIQDILNKTDAKALIMDRSWNQEFESATIDRTEIRVKSWSEIEKVINQEYDRINASDRVIHSQV